MRKPGSEGATNTSTPTVKVLYQTGDIGRHINQVLANPLPHERRVIIVAYVGGHAEHYLPNPNGLEIVCSLTPIATSSTALADLRNRGAKIFQSNRTHMKVYWSSLKGCVICSANVSSNALGRNGLKEAGVFLPSGEVDIDRLLAEVDPQPIRNLDLKRLQKQSDKARSALRSAGLSAQGSANHMKATFMDWVDRHQEFRPWKVGWWEMSYADLAPASIQRLQDGYGVRNAADWIDAERDSFSDGDWILMIQLPEATQINWMYADFVVEVPEAERDSAEGEGFPFQAIQAKPIQRTSDPPFHIDARFKRALQLAIREIGEEDFKGFPTRLTSRLLDAIKKHIARETHLRPHPVRL